MQFLIISFHFLFLDGTFTLAIPEFLMVGRRWDTDLTEPIGLEQADWKEMLKGRARTQGQQRSGDRFDYFTFPKGFLPGKVAGVSDRQSALGGNADARDI
jgi:hypothetical protein